MEYYEHKMDPVGVRPPWLADDDWMWPRNTYGDYVANNHGDADSNWAWSYITAIRIKPDHWAVPALKQGFKSCLERPDDYPGGEILWSNGCTTEEGEDLGKRYWERDTDYFDGYVIGYKPKATTEAKPDDTSDARMLSIIERIASNGVASMTDVRECEAIVAEREPVDPLIALFDEMPDEPCMKGETWPEKMAKLTRFYAAKHNLKIVEA